MTQTVKDAYKEGRKAASLEPQRQQERRANVLERAEAFSGEKMEKLKIHGSLLTEERKQTIGGFERLLMGRPIEAHRQNRNMGYIYLALFLVILAAEFWLLQWTFRPFNLGAESFIISLGLMIVGTTALEEYLRMQHSKNPEVYNKRRMWLVFFSAVFFIVSLLLLSNARAALISASPSAESLEAQVNTANQFYARTSFVYIAIALGSLAIAFVSGILLHEAISRLLVSGPVVSHAKKIKEMEHSIAQIASSIKELEALPRKTVNEFDRGVLDGPRSDENPLLSPIGMIVIAIILILAIVAFARGEERVQASVILLVDLTGSSLETDYLGKTEFDKNAQFVEEVMKKLEPGTRLRIVGISEKSFDRPYIVYDGLISMEKGYFSEKLAKNKLVVMNKWKEIKLQPEAKGTDVFGALVLASILFEKECKTKMLITLSDLRNSKDVDMENVPVVDANIMSKVEARGLVADLKEVKVWAVGVSTTRKSYQYWNSLKDFWTQYFQKTGANLISFSVERNWEQLQEGEQK
jgi:hypothetical protein